MNELERTAVCAYRDALKGREEEDALLAKRMPVVEAELMARKA